MTFHSGGFNRTGEERRAVNHVFTIPYFKQQIRLPELLKHLDLEPHLQELLDFTFKSQRQSRIFVQDSSVM